jgi:CBS domain-containing protein
MKVKEMMHKGVEWVSPDTSITAIAEMMQEGDIGAIPVGENDRLVGMVTDRDLAVRGLVKGTDISKLTAKDVMTKGVTWCRDNDASPKRRVSWKPNTSGDFPSSTRTREWSAC